MKFNQQQITAIQELAEFISNSEKKEIVLAGLAGTGKTTIVPEIVKEAQVRLKVRSLLTGEDGRLNVEYTATTNKAAKVLAEKLNIPTKTIHSLLGLIVEDDYRTGKSKLRRAKDYKPLANTVLFIDEASMINLDLLKEIRNSTKDCKVIYIGDPYQLNPVFENNCAVFHWINDQVKLTEVMRQDSNSLVPVLGEKYREAVDTSIFPSIITDSSSIIQCSGKEFQEAINRVFTETTTGSHNSKVVAWTNNKVHQYNDYIRSLYTQSPNFLEGEVAVTNKPVLGLKNSVVFSTDDLVNITGVSEPTTKNGIEGVYYELNHDIRIFQATNQSDVINHIKYYAKQKDWEEYFNLKNYFADLRPVHSCTVHKSQGSTYDNVFIDLEDIGKCNKSHEVARMLYVALTRTSGKAYLYGSLPDKYSGKSIEF